MNNNGWITDRLPTADDANTEGYVWIWHQYNGSMSEHYRDVHTGTPWAPKCPPPPYVKPRWKPKKGEVYFVCLANYVIKTFWNDDDYDHTSYGRGNCFQTEEEAQEVSDKFTQLPFVHNYLKSISMESNKRWKANNGEEFWYIDHYRNEARNAIYWRPEDMPNVSWGWRWDGKPPERTWMDDVYDFGNMFQTREDALQVLDKWNKVLKEHWDG